MPNKSARPTSKKLARSTSKKPARSTSVRTSTSHKPSVVWPARLWHGTSEKGLRKLRSAGLTEGLCHMVKSISSKGM